MDKKDKIISIDVGGTFIKWAILNSSMNIIEKGKFKTDVSKNEFKDIIKMVADQVKVLQGRYSNIKGVGLSMPGIINSDTSIVLTEINNLPKAKNTNIIKEFKKYCSVPIKVINDANAATLGEKAIGGLKDNKSGMLITIGTGIGGGVIVDNDIYQGHYFSAGEVGMQFIDGVNWEKLCSTKSLIKNVKDVLKAKDELTGEKVIELTKTNAKVKKVFDEWMTNIAKGLSNIIDVLNPETIIIGGGISENDAFDMDFILGKIKGMTNEKILENTKINKSSTGNDASLYGVFLFVKKELGL